MNNSSRDGKVGFEKASTCAFVLALAFAAACSGDDGIIGLWTLPDERAVDGIQAYEGRGVETVGRVRIDEQPWLEVRVRRSFPGSERRGTLDLILIPLEGGVPGKPRVIGKELLDSPAPRYAGDGVFWGLRDPRQQRLPDRNVTEGTLTAFGLDGIVREVPDVASWSNPGGGTLLFDRFESSTGDRITHFELADGRIRRFRSLRSGPTFLDGRILYIDEQDQLFRLDDVDAVPEPVRSGVARLTFGPGNLRDDLAIMTVSRPSGRATVVFDLEARSEVDLPGKQICCWLPFEGQEFVYAEGRSEDQPARLHRYHLTEATHRVLDLPGEMSDATRFIFRPDSGERLIEDSKGRFAVWQPGMEPEIASLDFRPLGPRYSRDGSFLLYVDKDPESAEPEGRLMQVDADFDEPPTELTPLGTTLRAGNYFTISVGGDSDGPEDDRELVVFWARFGQSASDLYFFDPLTRQTRFVAEAIRNVSVTPSRVFGILRTSQQDLTGDLVERDLLSGEETVFARSVDMYTILDAPDDTGDENLLVFVVRNRAPTSQDGVWIKALP